MRLLAFSIFCYLSVTSHADPRIIGGVEIKGDQAPWQLSLQTRSGTHFCGAVLIKANVALTAAHCVWIDDAKDIFIYGGSESGQLKSLKRLSGVSKIKVHPLFDRPTFTAHDLAILFLDRALPESQTVRPISMVDSLYPVKMDDEFHEMGQFPISTSGWGMTYPPNLLDSPSEQLKKVEQKPIGSVNVSIHYPEVKDYLFKNYDIGDSTIKRMTDHGAMTLVTDGVGEIGGTCSGDSGGPVVMETKQGLYLIGVSSYTAGGEKRCLGVSVHTNVQAYSDWITSEIETWEKNPK